MQTKTANRAARARPVLMIPLRRCGSHAIRLRLNLSPRFYSPYPLHIVDFMPLVKLYGDLENDAAYFQLVVDVIGLQTANMVRWDGVVFDPVEVFEAVRHRPRSVHQIVWELLLQAGKAHQAGTVMDKSLDSVHYADEQSRLFDDMLFLHVVRDPRAQIASMNHAVIYDFDTLLNARTWVRAHTAAHALMQRHPERVLTVRFEDFLADQEAVLKKICTFLGVEFLPQMLDIAGSDEAKRLAGRSLFWGSAASAPLAANVVKFRRPLSDDEIRVIETLTGEYMDLYGYARMTKSRVRITEEMIARARERSEERKRKAWSDIRRKNPCDYQLRRFRAEYIKMVANRLMREAPQALAPAAPLAAMLTAMLTANASSRGDPPLAAATP